MGRVETKASFDGKWFKRVLEMRDTSMYALGRPKESGGIGWNIRTIRRAVSEGAISPKLLNDLARALASSPRAVGGAVGRNPLSLFIPCHRVVGAHGALTGYAGGLDRKTALLRLEGCLA